MALHPHRNDFEAALFDLLYSLYFFKAFKIFKKNCISIDFEI